MSVGTVGQAGAFIAGLLVGIGGMGWYSGAWTTAASEAEKTQGAVNESVADAREIDGLDSKAAQSAERVITRTVTVAAECPNGNGPVSDALNHELQAVFSQNSASTRARSPGSSSSAE